MELHLDFRIVMRVGVKDAMTMSHKERISINVYAFTPKNQLSWKQEEADASAQHFTQLFTHANYAQKWSSKVVSKDWCTQHLTTVHLANKC